ncbi:MAG: fimbrillin family protein [Prevotella sp.]|nr:fimbrillin family protein [Prevotella sp.]
MKRKSFLLNSQRTLSNPSNQRTLSNPSNQSNQSTLSNLNSLSTLSSPILRNLGFLGFLWLLAACSLTSCSSDSSGSPASIVEEPVAKPRPLTVEVTEIPFNSQTNEQGARQLTRASEITISSLGNFFVFNNQNTDAITFEKSGSNWVGDGSWPGVANNTPVTFYATNIANSSAFVNGTKSFSFTVDEYVDKQKDLLAAKTTAAFSAGKGKISLAFDHITTAVTFSIALSANAAAKGTVVLKNAMLYNIPNTAAYSFTSDSWGTPAASKSDYTLTTGDITLSTAPQQLPCNYLFLIPQTLTAYHAESNPGGAYLEVKLTVDSGAEKTVRYPVALTLEQGWIQPVNIVIKAGAKDTDGNRIFD